MAVMTAPNSMLQSVTDYLNKYTPPYMDIVLHSHPADNSVHLKADLKVAVHWKHTDKSRFQQIIMSKVGRVVNGSGPDDYRRLVDQMLEAYAQELASGVIDGRQFNQFAFEGGTPQTLGAIPDPQQLMIDRAAQQYFKGFAKLKYAPNGFWLDTSGTIDVTGQLDDLTVKKIKDVINDHHSAAISTDTIRLSQAQLHQLMSDPHFPQSTPGRLFGHTLEVVK